MRLIALMATTETPRYQCRLRSTAWRPNVSTDSLGISDLSRSAHLSLALPAN
jgi:hypothetical protein